MNRTVLALVIGQTVSSLAMAESPADPGPVFNVNKVVVNATRMEQEVDEVNRSLIVVDKETIRSIQPQSTAQVLDYQANISATGGPRPGNQSVNIRGLDGQRVLQSIDGVRQVFESGHRPNYFLDPELISRVEVVKGPASSLWGSGALGGVVAQNTVSPSELLSPHQELGGFVKSGYNNNNHQTTTTAALAGRGEQLDWLMSGYYRDANDIELGNGEALEASEVRNHGAMAKLEWQLNDAHGISFNARQANTVGAVPSNGSAAINNTSNFVIDREQETKNLSIDYGFDTDSDLVNGEVLAFWNQVAMEETRVSDGRFDTTDLEVVGLNINNRSELAGITLFYGVDGYTESFKAQRSGDNRPTPPEAKNEVMGAFIQVSIPFADQWLLELGSRYDGFATEAKNLGEDRSDSAVSPSAAITWLPVEALKLTLRHDRAFRAPGAEELYSTGTHFCMGPGFCNTFVANPDLEPERAANTELLIDWQWQSLFGQDQLQVTASVFENKVDDFIEQIVESPTFFPPPANPGTSYWVNVEEATLRGYEISADYRRESLNLALAYGQTRGKDDESGEDLTNIPADTFTANLGYQFWQKQLHAGVRVTHAAEQKRTRYAANTDDTTYDGYTITDLYISWQPAAYEAVRIDLSANNVTDRDYRKAWSQLDQAGREIILSALCRF